ncbi:MAG TPA: multicopper oxidase domain-containing protein [Candidatus Kapabacteria bacterium]|nr:multicopper oxidase domain-containing protein [Candidatus Kapabacteria bacterium]
MLKSILAAVMLLVAVAGEAADTLYINRGTFVTVKHTTFPALAINSSPLYQQNSAVINKTAGTDLELVVINTDTVEHGFALREIKEVIPPGKSVSITIPSILLEQGIHLFYDYLNYPSNTYLGACGILAVSNPYYRSFFWNIREYQSSLNESLVTGGNFVKGSYNPNYFTINGLSYPDIQNDTTARVWGSVGDVIRIYITNTGQSMHSIHFHGFHAKCVYSTSPDIRVGWSKDTWALRPMQSIVLELAVDKAGRYSVHDHNLVAVSANNTHPNGMFTIMEFK